MTAIRLTNRRQSAIARAAARESNQDTFTTLVSDLATDYAAGVLDLPTWQASMIRALSRYMLAQAIAGARDARLTSTQVQRLETELTTQRAYLSRFADTIGGAVVEGKPMSVVAIARRAGAYAAVGKAVWHQLDIETNSSDGDVIVYVSRDDQGTCSACLEAEQNGPYLPSTTPMPGAVCLGGARCRCRLEREYNPALARRLAA